MLFVVVGGGGGVFVSFLFVFCLFFKSSPTGIVQLPVLPFDPGLNRLLI